MTAMTTISALTKVFSNLAIFNKSKQATFLGIMTTLTLSKRKYILFQVTLSMMENKDSGKCTRLESKFLLPIPNNNSVLQILCTVFVE